MKTKIEKTAGLLALGLGILTVLPTDAERSIDDLLNQGSTLEETQGTIDRATKGGTKIEIKAPAKAKHGTQEREV